MSNLQETIPRLELDRIVVKCVEKLEFVSRVKAMIQGKTHQELSKTALYHDLMQKANCHVTYKKWHPKLQGCVAKSLIIALACKWKMHLPESYKLGPVHRGCIEELPKDKPEIHNVKVDIKLSPEPSIAESFGLLNSQRPISLGFRTDGQDGNPMFTREMLDKAQLKMPQESTLMKHIKKSMRHMMAYRADPATMRNHLDTDLKNLCLESALYPNNKHGEDALNNKADAYFHAIMEGTEHSLKSYGRDIRDLNLSELERFQASIFLNTHTHTHSNASTHGLDKLAEPTATEKPMRDLTITKPIMVGNTNILEASEEVLVELIREAQAQKENNADLVEVSTKFAKKNEQLDKVITLLVKQLDKA